MNINKMILKIKSYFSKGLISAYLDHELDQASKAKVDNLIEQCPDAKAYYEQALKLDRMIKGMPVHTPSTELKQRIDNAIITMPNLKPVGGFTAARYRLTWIYAGTCAAVLLAVVTVVGIHSFKTHPVASESMLSSMDMYQNIELYKHMDMIEHLHEVMAVNQYENTGVIR